MLMEQIMADLLIKLDFEIKEVLNSDKHFKKWRIKKLIKEFEMKLNSLHDKDEYTARDLVNLALLVDIASTMQLGVPCTTTIDNTFYKVSCNKGTEFSRWPVISEIYVSTVYGSGESIVCKFISEMESDIDHDGKIKASYESSKPYLRVANSRTRTIESKSISVKDIESKSERNLNQIALDVLSSVFRIYHSYVVKGLESRWLK